MRIGIPVLYEISVIKRGKREPQHVTCGDVSIFEIPEIQGRDAPVALEWDDARAKGLEGWQYDPDCGRTRWHDGSHWMPLLVGKYSEPRTFRHADADDWILMRENGYERATPLSHLDMSFLGSLSDLQEYHEGNLPSADKFDRSKILSSTREILEGWIQHELTGKYAVIDGKLWVRCPEPRYSIWYNNSVAVTLTTDGPNNLVRQEQFRVDRYDDMLDHIAVSSPDREVIAPPPVRVLLPESINFDDEAVALYQSCHLAVETGYGLLKKAPVEAAMTWFRLRDAKTSVEAGKTAEDSELAWCLQVFADAFREQDHGIAEIADRALLRWQLRPVREEQGLIP